MKRQGILLVLVAVPLVAARVRIQDTLYSGNGKTARGSVEISWPAFRTAAGEQVVGPDHVDDLGKASELDTHLRAYVLPLLSSAAEFPCS